MKNEKKERIEEVRIKDIKVSDTPLERHITENIKWKNEEFELFKNYNRRDTLGNILIELCADIEETALRIQYYQCSKNKLDVKEYINNLYILKFTSLKRECEAILQLINCEFKILRKKNFKLKNLKKEQVKALKYMQNYMEKIYRTSIVVPEKP